MKKLFCIHKYYEGMTVGKQYKILEEIHGKTPAWENDGVIYPTLKYKIKDDFGDIEIRPSEDFAEKMPLSPFEQYVNDNAKTVYKRGQIDVYLFNQHSLTMDGEPKDIEKVKAKSVKNYVLNTLRQVKYLKRRGFKVEFIKK